MSVSALTFSNMSFECESLTLKMSGPMSDLFLGQFRPFEPNLGPIDYPLVG